MVCPFCCRVFQARISNKASTRRDRNKPKSSSYEQLGVAHAQKNHYAEAIKFFEKSLELNPQARMVNLKIAKCLAELKRFDEAQNYVDLEIRIAQESNDFFTLRDAVLFGIHNPSNQKNYEQLAELTSRIAQHGSDLLREGVRSNEFDMGLEESAIYLKKSKIAKQNNNPEQEKIFKSEALKILDERVTGHHHLFKVPNFSEIMTLAKLELEINGFENSQLRNLQAIEQQQKLLKRIEETGNKIPFSNSGGYKVYSIPSENRNLALLYMKEVALVSEHVKEGSLEIEERSSLLNQTLKSLDLVQEMQKSVKGIGEKIKYIHKGLVEKVQTQIKEIEQVNEGLLPAFALLKPKAQKIDSNNRSQGSAQNI